jgi:enolase-phosphatase E1
MSAAGSNSAGPRLYLLDIEGTVAPLSLTGEVLFPYARAHFEDFLRKSIAEFDDFVDRSAAVIGRTGFGPAEMGGDGVVMDLALLRIENENERDPDAPRIISRESAGLGVVSMSPALGIPRILAYVYWLMDRDRKSTALKSLQGKIWKHGFESGELKGMLFDDVPAALERWAQGARVAIYSSGSAEAQELLFRYSIFGDLTPLIDGYFDTRTGPKLEPDSYAEIARAMEVEPAEVMFLSDAVRELDAAREAGCETRLVIRPGNSRVAGEHYHPAVESFIAL